MIWTKPLLHRFAFLTRTPACEPVTTMTGSQSFGPVRGAPLPEPFIVLATQNPIEQEGTYPLPEAQLDRFMVQLTVGYPSREEEERIVAETTTDDSVDVRPVLTAAQLSDLLNLVRRLPAAPTWCRMR
jgi:MoxR-like ATPase